MPPYGTYTVNGFKRVLNRLMNRLKKTVFKNFHDVVLLLFDTFFSKVHRAIVISSSTQLGVHQ